MHINYRRGENRKVNYLRDYLRITVRNHFYRSHSTKFARRVRNRQFRAKMKQALHHGREMPTMKKTVLWDLY